MLHQLDKLPSDIQRAAVANFCNYQRKRRYAYIATLRITDLNQRINNLMHIRNIPLVAWTPREIIDNLAEFLLDGTYVVYSNECLPCAGVTHYAE